MSADRVLIFELDPRRHGRIGEVSAAPAFRYPEPSPRPLAPDLAVSNLAEIVPAASPFWAGSPALTSPFFRPAPGPDAAP